MAITPTIDYTNKDFQSLRQAMLAVAQYRLPEWTDQSPADLGNLLIDLVAYLGDVVLSIRTGSRMRASCRPRWSGAACSTRSI